MMKLYRPIPVILCGGSGSRLWPLSRKSLPKPFIPLPDGQTLFEKTILRAAAVGDVHTPVVVVTNQQLLYAVQESLKGLVDRPIKVVLEPEGRDTAAAIATAVASLHQQGVEADQPLLFMPADHLITPLEQFLITVEKAATVAMEGNQLTLLGIQPTEPHTGFGYIRRDKHGQVCEFIEKPDFPTAQKLINEGALWNSGMFLAPLGIFVSLFEQHAVEIWQSVQQVVKQAPRQVLKENIEVVRLKASEYAKVPAVSFDYAVSEKAQQLAVVQASFQWSDVGTWPALFDQLPPVEKGNRTYLQGAASQAYVQDGQSVSIWAEGERTVVACGVEDLIIVDMPDVVLVTRPDAADSVKQLYARLSKQKHPVTEDNPYTLRPWGHYVVLLSMPNYKVKKISVNPGQQLSYQFHRYRQENWVVVKGKAQVILDGVLHTLEEGDSIFIPQGAKHRLINHGGEPLEVVEVQYGSYLGEDDIERIEDVYIR